MTDEECHCTNSRAMHSTKTVPTARGKTEPLCLAFCYYHCITCIGAHDTDFPPKIATPNAFGLCSECYLHRMKGKPPILLPDAVPGVEVIPVEGAVEMNKEEEADMSVLSNKNQKISTEEGQNITSKGNASPDPGDSNEEEPSDETICGWRPNAEESLTNMRGYICCNTIYRHPKTRKLMKTCPMHIKYCIMPHNMNDGVIAIPNLLALCTSHYVAVCGRAPLQVPFPYPGMRRKLMDKGWLIRTSHWAAPTWPPQQPIISDKVRVVREKPDNYRDMIIETARLIMFTKYSVI